MNIRSAELLNQSIQNAADNLYRNRELAATMQQEAQRNAIEQSFRNAMMQHYANIEERQADNAGLQEKRLETEDTTAAQRQAGALQQEQQQAGITQKQTFLRTAMQLNATGQLSSDGLKRVNQWLSTDPDMSKTGIQLATPSNPSTDPAHAQTALANALSLRQVYQSRFDTEKDPYLKSQYSKVLGDIDASLGGKRNGNPQRTEPRALASGSAPQITKPVATQMATSDTPGNSALAPKSVDSPLLTVAAPPAKGAQLNAPGQNGAQSESRDLNSYVAQKADPRDVQWLTNNPTPSNVAQFEKVYGQGSSDPFFSPKMPSQQEPQ